ncbi:MAG: portal protein [Akkermansia sp.]
MEERVAELNSVYKSLAAQRAPWETWWDRLRDYVLPRRLNREGEVSLPNRDAMDRMTDTTAVEACQKLASGHMSYITPSHDVWFKWSAPDDRGGDEAEAWYNQCSEIVLKELSVSNFYTEIHECFLDRVALGTGSLLTGTSSDGRLLFTNIPCGQFACAENAEGRVDTYVREFAYTAHQARSMFGVKALGPKAREVLERGGNPYATTLRFLHVVRPRTRRSRRREQASHMPFESVYLSLDDQVIVEEGGYMEFLLVTRF